MENIYEEKDIISAIDDPRVVEFMKGENRHVFYGFSRTNVLSAANNRTGGSYTLELVGLNSSGFSFTLKEDWARITVPFIIIPKVTE